VIGKPKYEEKKIDNNRESVAHNPENL